MVSLYLALTNHTQIRYLQAKKKRKDRKKVGSKIGLNDII